MLIRAGGGEEEAEISLICLLIWIREGVDIDVVMIGAMVVAVIRLEQHRVVMASARFVLTREIAHQSTPTSCVVAS